jgi:hypothetical protein
MKIIPQDDGSCAEAFVKELRWIYPFVPGLWGITTKEFVWKSFTIKKTE